MKKAYHEHSQNRLIDRNDFVFELEELMENNEQEQQEQSTEPTLTQQLEEIIEMNLNIIHFQIKLFAVEENIVHYWPSLIIQKIY